MLSISVETKVLRVEISSLRSGIIPLRLGSANERLNRPGDAADWSNFPSVSRELLSVWRGRRPSRGRNEGGLMALTRRALLEHVGAVGGAGAAYLAMEAFGLAIPTPV